jgi:hypothetical protein
VRPRLTFAVTALLVCLTMPSNANATPARGPWRILYSSDWLGPMQIFALDPSGRLPLAQLTFGEPPRPTPPYSGCLDFPIACGYAFPTISPDGKHIAYGTPGGQQTWIAKVDGSEARSAEVTRWGHQFTGSRNIRSPDRRYSASINAHGITLVDLRTHRVRSLTGEPGFQLSWSPDSRSIAYITGSLDGNVAQTGDLKTVTITGRPRTLVRAGGSYGGQIVSVNWVRPAANAHWQAPAPADGVFAGGPVLRLAADRGRIAYAACLNVFSWAPRTSTKVQLRGDSTCIGPLSRYQVYDLAVAGDRIAWGWKTSGQAPYSWYLYASTVGSTVEQFTLASGLGYPNPEDSLAGSLVGSGNALIYGEWKTTGSYPGGTTVETLYRATSAGCPCPAIAYGAAPRAIAPLVPLDTDGERIAVLRYGSLVVLDTSGSELLAIPVAAAAAQLLDETVVVLVPGELRVYDVTSGSLLRSSRLPMTTVGRDCTAFSEPHCRYPEAQLRLQDAALGLAAYVLNGEVHIVRLADGHDAVVSFGTEARFTNDGVAIADGARVRLIAYESIR